MTTQDLISKLLGVKVYSDERMRNTTLTTTPKKIVDNHPGALQMTLINLGAYDIYIWVDESVSSSKGILVAANGGSYEIDYTRFMTLPTREFWGVTASNSSTVIAIRQAILQ